MNPSAVDELAKLIRRIYPKAVVRRAAQSPPPADGPPGAPPVDHTVNRSPFSRYAGHPVEFLRDVLGFHCTEDQERIARAIPGRAKVNAGHSTGKTAMAAALATWWFHTRDPSVVITTAPTERDVVDLLWTEIRLRHARALRTLPDYFVGPAAAEMKHHEEHWAKGYTARRGESFQGRHRPHMFFIFDESEGVDPPYWITTGTMYKPDPAMDHGWLAIGNPTTTSSQSYLEDIALGPDGNPKWNLFVLSCLSHPNVVAQLAGLPPPIPDAVTIDQIDQFVADWCTPVAPGDRRPTDVEWRPGSGNWYRPGPLFQSRVLGVRPVGGIDTVWSAAAFELACARKYDDAWCWDNKCGVTISIDPAAYGDDDTCVHVRSGPVSLHHEARNGWGPDQTAGRVKELESEWSEWYNSLSSIPGRPRLKPSDVDVVIEFDGGYGVGVHSHRGDRRRWRGVSAGSGSNAVDPGGRRMYANFRSEMWFHSASLAGWVDLSRLPRDVLARLRVQLTTPYYLVRPDGTRIVEPKRDIKERLTRSPDDADAFVISHAPEQSWSPTVVSPDPAPGW